MKKIIKILLLVVVALLTTYFSKEEEGSANENSDVKTELVTAVSGLEDLSPKLNKEAYKTTDKKNVKYNKTAPFLALDIDVERAIRKKINHICKIEIRRRGDGYRFSGCHSKLAIDELGDKARIKITIPPNSAGVYEAKVFAIAPDGREIIKSGNRGRSTFFPDSWDKNRIIEEVIYAVEHNVGQVSSSQYYGYSKDGRVKIDFYYTASTGAINSYFPSLRNN